MESIRSRRRGASLLAATIVLWGTACNKDEDLSGPSPSRPAANAVPIKESDARPGEKDFRDIAAVVPSFGGFYVDDNGRLTVVVVDSANDGSRAVAAVRALLARETHGKSPIKNPAAVIRRGQYSFAQLAQWRELAVQQAASQGSLVSVDLDEVNNRVTIGVERGASVLTARASVMSQLGTRGVPDGAVQFVEARRAKTTALLTDALTPIGGGQIITIVGSGAQCTAGFIALINSSKYLLTADHCLGNAGTRDSILVQLTNSGGAVGFEDIDPSLLLNTCGWQGWGCKAADVTAFKLTNLGLYPAEVGRIWRPQYLWQQGNHLLIGSYWPYFAVLGTQSSIYVGLNINKVGRVTGWTTGQVTATCVDHYAHSPLTSNYLLTCQAEGTHTVDVGDSGAPVFVWDGDNGAYLAGLNWGCTTNLGNNCVHAIFSPYSNIVSDFSRAGVSLSVATNVTLTAPTWGTNYLSGTSPVLNWTASSATNTSETTVYDVTRDIWDPFAQNTVVGNEAVCSTTGTTCTDNTLTNYFVPELYNGTTQPPSCYYYWVVYRVKARNSGLARGSGSVFFRSYLYDDPSACWSH
ncbi:MAG TPA: hypothetical protein VIP11_18460 [Gemmatimonadaceae bacterium]